MWIALEDIHRADGVGAEESKCHQSQAEQERDPRILRLIFASECKDDGTHERADRRENEVEELVLGNTLAAFTRNQVGGPIRERARDQAGSNSGYQYRNEAKSDMQKRPAANRYVSTSLVEDWR
nr:hypothetical protein CFP56_13011 [Quercus suber]